LPPSKCIVPHQLLKPGYGPAMVHSIKTNFAQQQSIVATPSANHMK